MSNRQRILDEALLLMNEQGAQAIGTKQITDATGISPGNLYYHFRNKEEIVRSLFATLDLEFRESLIDELDPPISPARFASFYLDSLNIAWKHRYFFGGLLHLLRKDTVLAARYRDMQTWALGNLENIARQVVRDGNMAKPRGNNGYHSLALNTWLIWCNWIRHVQVSAPDHGIDREGVKAGVAQIFDVMSPYLKPEYDKQARKILILG